VFLDRQRRSGRASPSNPITGAELVRIVAGAGFRITNADICAMVNHARRHKQPIGSNGRGYYWAVNNDELLPTITHLRERATAMLSAIHGLEHSIAEQKELPIGY
jgi:hypothetical protein